MMNKTLIVSTRSTIIIINSSLHFIPFYMVVKKLKVKEKCEGKKPLQNSVLFFYSFVYLMTQMFS